MKFVDKTISCKNCGNIFTRKLRTNQFCDRKCAGEYKRKRICKACEQCGTLFERHLCVLKKTGRGKYCSKKCFNLSQLKQNNSTRICTMCGSEKLLNAFHLRSKSSDRRNSRCKDCSNQHAVESSHTVHNRYLRSKQKAKIRKLEWGLTENEFEKLISQQCHYCGGNLGIAGVGLDRKNNELGYLVDNVTPCCKRCNIIKNDDLSYEEMMLLSPTLRHIRINRNNKLND